MTDSTVSVRYKWNARSQFWQFDFRHLHANRPDLDASHIRSKADEMLDAAGSWAPTNKHVYFKVQL